MAGTIDNITKAAAAALEQVNQGGKPPADLDLDDSTPVETPTPVTNNSSSSDGDWFDWTKKNVLIPTGKFAWMLVPKDISVYGNVGFFGKPDGGSFCYEDLCSENKSMFFVGGGGFRVGWPIGDVFALEASFGFNSIDASSDYGRTLMFNYNLGGRVIIDDTLLIGAGIGQAFTTEPIAGNEVPEKLDALSLSARVLYCIPGTACAVRVGVEGSVLPGINIEDAATNMFISPAAGGTFGGILEIGLPQGE